MPENLFEKEKTYSICITPLFELPETLSENKKNLGWPLEIQGYAFFNKQENKVDIRYPVGDFFVSFGVIIHELGHLRQDEFNLKFLNEDNYLKYIETKELDAYERGLNRFKNYCPQILVEIENKFLEYKKLEKLKNFLCFEDFYKFLYGTININKAILNIPENNNQNDQELLEVESLKNFGIEKFFEEIKNSYVNEKIDIVKVEKIIKELVKKILEEE